VQRGVAGFPTGRCFEPVNPRPFLFGASVLAGIIELASTTSQVLLSHGVVLSIVVTAYSGGRFFSDV